MQTRKPGNDVDRIVARIDETRVAEHWRNPDRPDGTFVRSRRRQDPKVTRAKARARTAMYRNRLDHRRAPTTYQIAMALVVALVTSRLDELTASERGLVGRMLVNLQSRGFSVVESQEMLIRLRNRMVDPADRGSETTVSAGKPNSSPLF
jgi:hypothetical protein